MTIHICGGVKRWSDPKPAHEIFNDTTPDEKILTTCCVCYQRADECLVTHSISDPDDEADMGNWCDPIVKIVCAPGTGCDKRPSRRNGAYLREMCTRECDDA